MDANGTASTRLYLMKDKKQSLYINLKKSLAQHQIDGIRSLYRQYRKQSPGVILNDPVGCDNILQTVLFLDAIRPILDKPILVLTHGQDIEQWQDHFRKWTSYSNDIIIESSNQFAKDSMVFINTTKDAQKFSRRSWSVVVVYNSDLLKDILQINFKTDFKIWVTSVNMQRNLGNFYILYKWLFPKNKEIENFNPNESDMKNLDKTILIETFFEDAVIGGSENSKQQSKTVLSGVMSSKNISIKNKDPTGTKVKRTKKRRIIDDDDEIEDIPTVNQKNRDEIKAKYNDNEFNICTKGNDLHEINNSNNSIIEKANEINIQSSIAKETVSNELEHNIQDVLQEECDTMEFQNAVNDVVNNENNMCNEDSQDTASEALVYDEDTEPYDVEDSKDVVGVQSAMDLGEPLSKEENTNTIATETKENTKVAEEPTKNVKSLEEKLAELEERALKMFKGTLLDKIF